MPETLLNISRLQSGYGSSQILRDVSLSIEQGEIVCLLGRNGVGKSTLLKTLTGLIKASAGSLQLQGQDITRMPTHLRARAGLGYVPQGREVLPQFTVEENLLLGTLARASNRMQLPDDIFVYFPMLRSMLRRKAGMLSGGQQQQLALARALMGEPRLLLLDEPTEGIQPSIVQEIGEIIQRLNREKGIAVLLVEQKIPFARRLASRFFVMERGDIAAQGPIEQLDQSVIASYLEVA